eukprot:TRINITY_DN5543_c1_g1_i2.p1 TRINITY_DN5543_c1_g1~~TRINITY_DN5543_c1_g1_i2.p1  ORF type:complete len:202 (+),score=49.18 TRINITY_DN5543_c1_g1_i2:109-714(+)
MGLLILGSALSWAETRRYVRYVRQAGIEQFLNVFSVHKDAQSVPLVWGDEIEYTAVYFDHSRRVVRVALVASQLLPSLQGRGDFIWTPEFGDYMLEGLPFEPFSSELSQLLGVEEFLKSRRQSLSEALSAVNPNIVPLSISTFPRLGCDRFTEPPAATSGEINKSVFIPDDMINTHTRYRCIELNIRERRGERIAINVPSN